MYSICNTIKYNNKADKKIKISVSSKVDSQIADKEIRSKISNSDIALYIQDMLHGTLFIVLFQNIIWICNE